MPEMSDEAMSPEEMSPEEEVEKTFILLNILKDLQEIEFECGVATPQEALDKISSIDNKLTEQLAVMGIYNVLEWKKSTRVRLGYPPDVSVLN